MENIGKNEAKRTKKKAVQRWPYIKRRPYPSGLISWIVDARTKSGGERKTFATFAEAETYADGCRIRRSNEGLGAFGNEELARFGKTVQEAINFTLSICGNGNVPFRSVRQLLNWLPFAARLVSRSFIAAVSKLVSSAFSWNTEIMPLLPLNPSNSMHG